MLLETRFGCGRPKNGCAVAGDAHGEKKRHQVREIDLTVRAMPYQIETKAEARILPICQGDLYTRSQIRLTLGWVNTTIPSLLYIIVLKSCIGKAGYIMDAYGSTKSIALIDCAECRPSFQPHYGCSSYFAGTNMEISVLFR